MGVIFFRVIVADLELSCEHAASLLLVLDVGYSLEVMNDVMQLLLSLPKLAFLLPLMAKTTD